jgi:hypothetical protein
MEIMEQCPTPSENTASEYIPLSHVRPWTENPLMNSWSSDLQNYDIFKMGFEC